MSSDRTHDDAGTAPQLPRPEDAPRRGRLRRPVDGLLAHAVPWGAPAEIVHEDPAGGGDERP